MVLIVKKGTVPPTPHTEFYAIPKVLTKEEIHGSYGFSGAWSRKIHVRFYPTEQVKPPKKSDFALVPDFPHVPLDRDPERDYVPDRSLLAEGLVPPHRVNASDQLRPALLQQGGPGHPHVTGRRDRDRDAGPASVPRRAWRVPDRRETR